MRNQQTVKIKSPEKRARIGERIKIAATSSGLTLKELAEKVGTSPAFIYQYVRGITNVPPDILRGIAAATRVSVEFFDPDKDTRSAMSLPVEIDGELEIAPSKDRVVADVKHLQQLYEAHEKGRNPAALIDILNQLLSLTRVSGDRKQEAYTLWRIGVVRNGLAEFDEARTSLLAARDIFEEQGLGEYKAFVLLDLAETLTQMGSIEAAIDYNREVLASGSRDIQWRAHVNIGGLHYRLHEYDKALASFMDAARALETVDDNERDSVGMPYLMSHVAGLAHDTGHYDAALSLWSRSLAQATQEKQADVFLEALLQMARGCQSMGKISEARQRLEQAVVLATFMFDDQQRLGVAKAYLADVMAALGSLEEARENARASMRIANRVGGPKGMILASMAMAETSLASGQLDDALAYADEAISEAQRSRRPHELAQARNLRARVCLRLAKSEGGQPWIREAEAEGRRALETAQRVSAVAEVMAVRVTLSHCLQLQGREQEAEEQAQMVIDLTGNGAVELRELTGADTDIPELLKSRAFDLEKLFSGKSLHLPGLEWQAHYLRGTLQAKRLGPEAAFVAMKDAANAVARLLTGLTQDDAEKFGRTHPEIASVFHDLKRFALTEADQKEASALMSSAPFGGLLAERAGPALIGA